MQGRLFFYDFNNKVLDFLTQETLFDLHCKSTVVVQLTLAGSPISSKTLITQLRIKNVLQMLSAVLLVSESYPKLNKKKMLTMK